MTPQEKLEALKLIGKMPKDRIDAPTIFEKPFLRKHEIRE